MDPNAQQSQQSIAPHPVQQVSKSTPTTSLLLKIVLIIFGVVIVLGLIGGAYYLGNKNKTPYVTDKNIAPVSPTMTIPTSMPTVAVKIPLNRKNYSNVSLAYSFEYPPSWYLYPSIKTTLLDSQTVSPASYTTRDTDGIPAGDYIDVWVDNNAKNLSVAEWAKENLRIPIKLTPQTINGIVWYRTTDYPFYIGGEAAFTMQGGKVFDIAWTKTGEKLKISPKEFLEILSSFKFTN